MTWDPNKIREREWPGPGGPSIQVEIGAFGVAAPVTILASADFSTAYVSARDITHQSVETAQSLCDCLAAAINLIQERQR